MSAQDTAPSGSVPQINVTAECRDRSSGLLGSLADIRTQRDVVFTQSAHRLQQGRGSDAGRSVAQARRLSARRCRRHAGSGPGARARAPFIEDRGRRPRRGLATTAEYCRRFAALGWPSFSVQYRLAQTDPEPSRWPVLAAAPTRCRCRASMSCAREMGLPPIAPSDMARVMEAAVDDVTDAVRSVKTHRRLWHRSWACRVGQFLGGADGVAAYTAYGKRVGVAGVVFHSAPLMPADAAAYLAGGHERLPPLLMTSGKRGPDTFVHSCQRSERQFLAAGARGGDGLGCRVAPISTRLTSDRRRHTVFEVIRGSISKWVGP